MLVIAIERELPSLSVNDDISIFVESVALIRFKPVCRIVDLRIRRRVEWNQCRSGVSFVSRPVSVPVVIGNLLQYFSFLDNRVESG